MSMLPIFRAALAVALLIVLAPQGEAGDDKEKGEEIVPPPKPPELKVLNRFLGTWDTELVSKPAAWSPKETKSQGVSTFTWTLDGRFLRSVGKSVPPEKAESMQMMTYDPVRKEFYMWFFDSFGTFSESAGQWDADNQVLTWKAEPDEKLTSINRVQFVDKNTVQWTMTIKDKENKLYLDLRGKMQRRKE